MVCSDHACSKPELIVIQMGVLMGDFFLFAITDFESKESTRVTGLGGHTGAISAIKVRFLKSCLLIETIECACKSCKLLHMLDVCRQTNYCDVALTSLEVCSLSLSFSLFPYTHTLFQLNSFFVSFILICVCVSFPFAEQVSDSFVLTASEDKTCRAFCAQVRAHSPQVNRVRS